MRSKTFCRFRKTGFYKHFLCYFPVYTRFSFHFRPLNLLDMVWLPCSYTHRCHLEGPWAHVKLIKCKTLTELGQSQSWIQSGQWLDLKQCWRRTWTCRWKIVSVSSQPRQPPKSWAASKVAMAAGEGGDFVHRIFILSSEWIRKLNSNNSNKFRILWALPKYLAVTSPTMPQKANPGLVTTEHHIWVGTYRQSR